MTNAIGRTIGAAALLALGCHSALATEPCPARPPADVIRHAEQMIGHKVGFGMDMFPTRGGLPAYVETDQLADCAFAAHGVFTTPGPNGDNFGRWVIDMIRVDAEQRLWKIDIVTVDTHVRRVE
jgi:hypothetical protein